jgi:hypothetical protein
MTYRHDERDLTSPAGAANWLVDTARRNPEALLVLAAGVALLLRGGRSSARATSSGYRRAAQSSGEPPHDYVADIYEGGEYAESGREQPGRIEAARESVGEMARDASGYASDVAERVYETAGSYASSVASYADEQRRFLTRQAYRISDQAGEMLHERPLAVAALGLAAGAAVAAILPSTQVERRTLRPARDKILETASRTADAVVKAAAETVTHVQEEAAERGLSAEGLKAMARDAGETFTKTVSQEATKAAETKPGGGESSASAASGSSTQVRTVAGSAPGESTRSTFAGGSASASGSGRQGAGPAGSGSPSSPAAGGGNRLGPGATGTPSGGALDQRARKGPASSEGAGGGTGTGGGSGPGGGTKR